MLYQFLYPLNEVHVDHPKDDICIPISTKSGIEPLIVLAHLEQRHQERTKPFIQKDSRLAIPWKTILSNYIKNLNKSGSKVFKDMDHQLVSRTYIEILDKDGNYLGHFECGIVGKKAPMIGKPNKFYTNIMNKYKLKRGGRILTIETYVCLATRREDMETFKAKDNTTFVDNKYKTIVMTKEEMRELEFFSVKAIRG